MPSVQQKRGVIANLPATGLKVGELHVTTDEHTLHVPTDSTTMVPVVPDIAGLDAIPSIAGSADCLLIHDASETGKPKQKKVTFNALKAALAIPAASTDELVSVVEGGTAGSLWGTDGMDGVIRMNTSMSWSKDAGDEFVTLAVNAIDCGTF